MPKEIATHAERAIGERVFPGCVIGIVRKSGERWVLPLGKFTYEPDAREVREDSVYDVASVTKSIPTASLALTLIAEGRLKLTDAIRTHLPELTNHRDATIEDLLRYRVRGVQLSTLKDKSPDEIIRSVFARGFDAPPGAAHYTNLPAFLLGIIIERIAGTTLEHLAHQVFFAPLGMKHTSFFPRSAKECAPTEIDEWRGLVQGLPHDESAYAFARDGRAAPHAGLFSTAGDLLNVLEALLHGDLPAVEGGAQRGLGWQTGASQFMGGHAGPQTFGKTGFTGTSVVCDINRGIAFVILSNRTYPKRPASDTAIYRFRAAIADSVFGSLG